jgi:hypothetical protein
MFRPWTPNNIARRKMARRSEFSLRVNRQHREATGAAVYVL